MKRFFSVFLCCVLAVSSLAACGNDAEESSPSSVKRDNSIPFNEMMETGVYMMDDSESYFLDGDFDSQSVATICSFTYSEWLEIGLTGQYAFAVDVLNMWMYYGDDASIRVFPSELVDAISLDFSQNYDSHPERIVLQAINDYAKPVNPDAYYTILNVQKPVVTTTTTSLEPADVPEAAMEPIEEIAGEAIDA